MAGLRSDLDISDISGSTWARDGWFRILIYGLSENRLLQNPAVPQFTGHSGVYPEKCIPFSDTVQYVVICSIIFHTTISPLSPLHLYQSVSYP